jgi:selenocysteine lyase/cysteine desulfurase
VRSNGGGRQDLERLAAAARAVGARVLVDATHSAGLLRIDAERLGLDAVVCAAYKHLLCPRGVAFMRIAPDLQRSLLAINASWVSADPRSIYGGDASILAADARRFDVSLAWHPWVGALESLRFLNTIPLDERESWSTRLATSFAERVGAEPTGSSVVGVPVRTDVAEIERTLAEADVAASIRAGDVRVSFHVYNTQADADYAADVIAPLR